MRLIAPGGAFSYLFHMSSPLRTDRDADGIITLWLDPNPAKPRGGVYYSCLGRGANLFGSNSEELRTIENALGDVPIAGFFCNGEISHNRLYGYTGVLTLFV